MKSVMMDVVSVRARRTKHRIVYRIVDEYTDEEREYIYKVSPKTSIRPLKLRQLIAMIDGAAEMVWLDTRARASMNTDLGAPRTLGFRESCIDFLPTARDLVR